MGLGKLVLAVSKSAFFSAFKIMLGGLVFIALLLAFLYLVFGREKRR